MFLITLKLRHSGLPEAMTVVSCHFEQSKHETFTLMLDCRDDRCHSTTVQPELDWITLKAGGHQRLRGGVGSQVAQVELVEILSDTGKGWTGEEEMLHSTPVGVIRAPTQRQGTQSPLVPWNPMRGQSLHPGTT